MLEEDYGEIEGMGRFRQAVQNMKLAENEKDLKQFYALIQGHRFQFSQVEKSHQKGKIKSTESKYEGASGSNRYADVVTTEGVVYEYKAYAKDYNPSQDVKEKFRQQASDYAKSGKTVVYVFSNNPPDWAAEILKSLGIKWEKKT